INGQSFWELNSTRIDPTTVVKCIPEVPCKTPNITTMCGKGKESHRCLVSIKDHLPHCSNNNLKVDGKKGATITCDEDTELYMLDGKVMPNNTKLECGELGPDFDEKTLQQCSGQPEESVTKWQIMTGVVGVLLAATIGVFVWQLMSFMKVYKK
ncbi:hypothetical protein PFISCL1PPCAC_11519, partial [Pristionchus fissidentatus]